MMFDRRLVTHFDWRLAGTGLFLALLGIAAIYSANSVSASAARRALYLRQATWLLLGLLAMAAVSLMNYRTMARLAYPTFGLSLLSLVLVLLVGKIGLGAQRWIRIGALAFQPSEFAKLGLVLFLARYGEDHRDEPDLRRRILVPVLLTLVPMALVLKQPDLGTALILGFIALAMMGAMGLGLRHLVPIGLSGAVLFPLLWAFLKEYQRRRIRVFLNPEMDPLGAGYHIAQSKIAVGSGGLWGKGWMAASQSQLNFLPQNHTDFIFAVVAEQWGFVGSFLLLLVYFYLLSKALRVAKEANDLFASLLALGVTMMLAFQVVVNVAMVMGMMPIVGIPLPLLSYGGSSMLVTMLAVGLLLGIHMRRFMY